MADVRLPFKVVKGPEDNILIRAIDEGCVYFTTDTKKIYLDTKNERLAMGGNTGIYYADSQQPEEDLEYFFSIEEIEDQKVPNVKDLLLNTDGCFYKVEEVYDNNTMIKASRLTIAGSGGGGGGTGPNLAGLTFNFLSIPHNAYKTILAGRPFVLEFFFEAKDSAGELTGPGRYELKVNNVLKKQGPVQQGNNSIDLGDLFNVIGDYSVEIKCYGDIGGSQDTSRTRKFQVKSTLFTVKWDYNDTKINNLSKDFNMSWNVSVESQEKTSYIIIDDKYTFETPDTSLTITSQELNDLGIGHGTHKFELFTKAYIGDDDTITESDHVIQNVMFWDDLATEDPGFIVNCKYFESSIEQYNTIQIPVMIYHKTNNPNGNAVITFNVDGNYKSKQENCKNLEYYTFSFTPDSSGFISLSFVCGTGEKSFILEVTPLDIKVEEVLDYEFKFKATDFTNDEEIKNWTYNGNKITFSENFDWINGGLKSGADDVGPYFKIQAGSSMTIPCKIFETNLMNTGGCFKFIFKASNCRDYDASVIDCVYDGRGLALNAQGCKIMSNSNELEARYCEDTYIEYEFDVCKFNENDVTSQYLTIWMDGVPAGVTQIVKADSFAQANGRQKYLTIGSEDCDVYVYLIKFYKKHLNFDEHLQNFIIDAANSTDMVSRFNRNDIVIKDSRGNSYISPELLAEKNPECNVFIYEIPKIPTSKKDVYYDEDPENTKCCKFTLLKGSKEAIKSFDKVSVRAQGTSSMSYGISAYNLDAKFPEKWSLDDEAIPVNYFNTKVNVASCEGANNALNQEWYNRFQPYKTQKRLQTRDDNKVARDTMEFKNGILFLQDNNKKTNSATATDNNVFKEIAGYVDNPYPRMYSIGNMGNSKKNVDVFHGAGNAYECCVEVADNNTSAQQMTIIGGFFPQQGEKETDEDYIPSHEVALNLPDELFDENGFVIPGADWGKSVDIVNGEEIEVDNKTLWTNSLIGEGFFEFRYCIDEEDFVPTEEFSTYADYQEKLSNNFLRLVRWFAKNNPSQATNEEFPEPITIPAYTVKGIKSTAYSNYPTDSEVLKGTTFPGDTFTKDNADYRVAKMLQESENYLILDSVVYHYLFIERHTMVDNVAKNTFWNTEDGTHWEMTKNYDNDTADGVNNNGYLVFDYGTEIMDEDSAGASVFNASSSAWLHFVYGLNTLKDRMYQVLYSKGAWNSETYLNTFSEGWQDAIPEVCWIEDFNRKYFRPNNVYGDKDYLVRLANGKKTHQRKQYETYQEQYMNSKYKTNTEEGASIQWRSKQPENTSIQIDGEYVIEGKVKLYADGYFTAAIASGAGEAAAVNIHKRGKKGEIITFSRSQRSTFNDATCYVYTPDLYQEFLDVQGLYPRNLNLTAGNKLRKISFIPENQAQKEVLDDSLSFGTNIEEIILKDCVNAKMNLDLSKCIRIKTVDTTGSAFTSFSIADGAPLTNFKVNNPASLILSNLRYLKKKDEEDNDTFLIEDYTNLSQIQFNSIDYNDVNTKDILENITKESIEYNLGNVKWKFEDNDGITDSSIPLLDFLLEGTPLGGSNASSLTGTAEIPSSAYSGNNALSLYEKYSLDSGSLDNTFPNLELNFTGAGQRLYSVEIRNGDEEVKWSRKFASFADITNDALLNSSKGPIKIDEAVSKRSSTTEVFTFNNQWKCYSSEGVELGTIKNDSFEDMKYLDLSQLVTIIGNNPVDVIIKPDYSSTTRFYTVRFYVEEEDGLKEVYTKFDAQYGDSFDQIKPTTVYIKNDEKLALRTTYRLKGYSAAQNNTTVINTQNWRLVDNSSFYCVYEEVSVYDVDYRDYLRIENNILRGFVKNEAGEDVYQGGKIVIPSNVTSISANAFVNNRHLKNVFTNDNHFSSIGSSAFQSSVLEYFDFDSFRCTIERIEDNAFKGCPFKGKHYGNTMALPEGLTYIGAGAFNGGGDGGGAFADVIDFTILVPSSVTRLGQLCIANISDTQNMTIQIGNQNAYSNLDFNEILAADTPFIGSNATVTFPNKDITKVWLYKLGLKPNDTIDKINKTVRKIFVGDKAESLLTFEIYPKTM